MLHIIICPLVSFLLCEQGRQRVTAWKVSKYIRRYFWSVFSCILTEYRKIQTRNNTIFGQFSHKEWCSNYENWSFSSIFSCFSTFLHQGLLLFLVCLFKKQPSRGALRKVVLKICSKFTKEDPCQSAISIKLAWKKTKVSMKDFYTGGGTVPSRENPFIPYINEKEEKLFFTILKI